MRKKNINHAYYASDNCKYSKESYFLRKETFLKKRMNINDLLKEFTFFGIAKFRFLRGRSQVMKLRLLNWGWGNSEHQN